MDASWVILHISEGLSMGMVKITGLTIIDRIWTM